MMKPFWVSWYDAGELEYSGPWWVSGYRYLSGGHGDEMAQAKFCAAVMAESEEDAMRRVAKAHDDPSVEIEWSFAIERPADWSPFCDLFEREDWMEWPWPKENDK